TVPGAAQHARLARRALGDGSMLREQTSESMAIYLAIMALFWCGCVDEAHRAVDEVLADARSRGDALAYAEASSVRALIMYGRGRIAEAIADAQAAIEGMERGWRGGPVPQPILAHCMIERGQLDLAEAVLQTVPLLPPDAAIALNVWVYWARGRLRLARSQGDAALDDFLLMGEILDSYGLVAVLLPWRSLAAVAAHATGDRERAVRLANEGLE